MYSEDSSDDEFFDPEEEVAPPSPSWLTRQQSVGVGSTEDRGAGEIQRAGSGGDPGSSSPSAAAATLFLLPSAAACCLLLLLLLLLLPEHNYGCHSLGEQYSSFSRSSSRHSDRSIWILDSRFSTLVLTD